MSLGDRLVPQGSVSPRIWPKNGHRAVQVLPRPEKMVGGDGSLKANGMMLAHNNANRKNLDHIGFPKANNLATLLLGGERATKTNLDRMGSSKANNLATPVLDCERATETWITLVP